MDIKDLVLSDEALDVIDNGTWVGDFPEAPGLELLVCGLRAQAAQKTLEQKQAQARIKNRGQPLTNDQLAKAMRETLVEVVLKDWRGLMDGNSPIEYSRERASQWLMSRNGEQFAALVLAAAQRVDIGASDFVGEVTKN